MKERIEAVLWDNDGVLVDTEHLFFEACRDVLHEHDIELGLDDFIDISLTQGRSCFDLLADRGASAEQLRAAKRRRDAVYSETLAAGVPLIAGVRDTLRLLHGRVPMAIVTSCQPEHFALIHARTEIVGYFEFVLASGDYRRHKPHPEPYLTAAERLGVAPERCLVVEDSERGVRAAVAAGMQCVALPSALTRCAAFPGVSAVLSNVREVIDHIDPALVDPAESLSN